MIRLTRNINIYKTPGHSVDDITAVVNCVPNYGSVAVVGDLILHEADDGVWRQYAWNVSLQMANRQKILCLANWIVPGHGPMFQVYVFIHKLFIFFMQLHPNNFR